MELINSFKSGVSAFQNRIFDMQEKGIPKEYIGEDDVVKAMIVLNLISYKNEADVFLGCASINLVNAYMKQKKPKLGYNFRRHLNNLLKGIDDIKQPQTIQIIYDNSSNLQILMVVICNFQFSYKFVYYSEQIRKIEAPNIIEWDGLQKQPYAKTVFDYALASPYITKETLGGNNLINKLNEELLLYKSGNYVFRNNKLIKKGMISVATNYVDKELKNYYRIKLLECNERPVILTGKFERIWEKHVTFSEIRPYIEGLSSLTTVCDHINLLLTDVEKYIELDALKKNKRYYIIGYCAEYGNGRIGVNLATNNSYTPIFLMDNTKRIPRDILSTCHRFSIEEYISRRQKRLKL